MKNKTKTIIFLGLSIIGICLSSCKDPKTKSADVVEKDSSRQDLEANKKLVLDFYQQMFGDKDVTAVDRYISPAYIQHNPNVADGSAAFKEAAKKWFEGQPKTKIDVQHIAAEKDLVFIHLKNKNPDGSLKSTIDIFRIENGKIVEHWDVHQDVPKVSANDHPMF